MFKVKNLLPKSKKSRQVEEFKNPQTLKFFTDVAGRTPVNYVLPEEVFNLKRNLPTLCKNYMQTGIDEFNAAYADAYIHNMLELAKDNLKEQREHHQYVIQQLKNIDNVYRIKYLNEREQIKSAMDKFSEGGKSNEEKQ